MKPIVTWIVLADGDQARFFENRGPGKGLKHLKKLDMRQETLKNRDIMADRPGRAFSSHGDGRSAMEPPTDPVAKREDDFCREVTIKLSELARAKKFDRLVIAAAPRALGALRHHFDEHVREKLFAEVDKNLVNIPDQKLAKHFEDVILL